MRIFSDIDNRVLKEEEVMVMIFYLMFWEVEDFQWEESLFHIPQLVLEDRGYTFQVMGEVEGQMVNKIDKDNNNQKYKTWEIM